LPSTDDDRFRQHVLDVGLGQNEQRLHELLLGAFINLNAHVAVSQTLYLRIEHRHDFMLIGQRQLNDLDLLLQRRKVGEVPLDKENVGVSPFDLPREFA
jgi:hypothetical protein